VSLGEPQQLGDRLPQPAVAGGGWLPIEVQRDRHRFAERIAGGAEDPGGEVVSVQVDREAAMLAEFVQ
jgi:hypothetical protein